MSEKEAITILYNHYKAVLDIIKFEDNVTVFVDTLMETHTFAGMCACCRYLDIKPDSYNWFSTTVYLTDPPHHFTSVYYKRKAIKFRVKYLKQLYEKVLSNPDSAIELQPDNSRIEEAK